MDSPELRANSDVYYSIGAESVDFDVSNGVVKATLTLASASDATIAQTLDMTLTVY